MEQKNDKLRERLLSHLPRPENITAYREETATLLAKHEKALFWEKMVPKVCYLIAAIMVVLWLLGLTPAPAMRQYFWPLVGSVYFMGLAGDLGYRIYQSKVDILKEVKQVQLQILELQASLRDSSDVPS
jgi:hypothetical protein